MLTSLLTATQLSASTSPGTVYKGQPVRPTHNGSPVEFSKSWELQFFFNATLVTLSMFALANLLQETGLLAAFLPVGIPQVYTWYGFGTTKYRGVCFVAQRCRSDGLQISHREQCIFSAILGFDLSELTLADRWARGRLGINACCFW